MPRRQDCCLYFSLFVLVSSAYWIEQWLWFGHLFESLPWTNEALCILRGIWRNARTFYMIYCSLWGSRMGWGLIEEAWNRQGTILMLGVLQIQFCSFSFRVNRYWSISFIIIFLAKKSWMTRHAPFAILLNPEQIIEMIYSAFLNAKNFQLSFYIYFCKYLYPYG